MEIFKLYCKECKQCTKHRVKLDASKENKSVCNICDIMNFNVSLIRKLDGLIKTSEDFMFITFDKEGKYNDNSKIPKINSSLLLSPFNEFFTWQTTSITKILKIKNNYIKFETKNSSYELFYK